MRGVGRLPGKSRSPRAKQLSAHTKKYHSNKKNNDVIFIFLLSSND